jgi:hypothetical protein
MTNRPAAQLARNLEAAATAPRGGVLLAVENEIADLDMNALVTQGCPHLNEAARRSLTDCFRGQVTWRELCLRAGIEWTSLPHAMAVTPKAARQIGRV